LTETEALLESCADWQEALPESLQSDIFMKHNLQFIGECEYPVYESVKIYYILFAESFVIEALDKRSLPE